MEGLRRLPRRVGGPHHWVVRQSSHLAAVPLEAPDCAAARAMAPLVHLVLPKEHAILLVPGDNGELEPRVPSMQALQQVREMEWRSLAARPRAHTPLAGACEAMPLGAMHHGPTHRNMLRARDGRLSTMQVMRRWRQKLTRMAIPAHPCIFCGGPEEDIGHMRLLCARDEEVAGLLCRRVEEFTAELPLTDRAVEFVAWREHGCRWTESLMAGVVPGDLKRLFAAVRAASSRGPAKARLFVEDMVQIGEDVYASRNHRLTQIMQLPMQDRRRAVYAFLRGDTPFCPPAGGSWSVRRGTRLPASPATCGQPFRGHCCTHCWCRGRASSMKRPCPCSLTGWQRWRRPSTCGSVPGWRGTSRHSGSGPAWYRRSRGPRCVVPR